MELHLRGMECHLSHEITQCTCHPTQVNRRSETGGRGRTYGVRDITPKIFFTSIAGNLCNLVHLVRPRSILKKNPSNVYFSHTATAIGLLRKWNSTLIYVDAKHQI